MGFRQPRVWMVHLCAAALLLAAGGCAPEVVNESVSDGIGGSNSNTWTTLAPMPTPVNAGCAGAVGNRIYVFQGASTYIYDTTTDSWSTGTTMPIPRADTACAVVGGLVYVIGGYNTSGGATSDAIQFYNPGTNGWTVPGVILGLARHALGAAVVNGLIYIFGGYDGSTQVGDTEEYVPGGGITSGTGMTIPLSDIKGAGDDVGGRVFTFGGKNSLNLAVPATRFYDIGLDNWNNVTNGTARYGVMVEQVSGQIYVFGGFDNSTYFNENARFDPVSWTWTSLADMPTARYLAQSAVVNGVVYVMGGIVAGGGGTDVNEAYTP